MKICFWACLSLLILTVEINAQPYIYYSISTKTDRGKVLLFNLATDSVEDFLLSQETGLYSWTIWDPGQSFLMVELDKEYGTYLFDLKNINKSFDLTESFSVFKINEILFSEKYDNLYLLLNDYKKLCVFDLKKGLVKEILNLGEGASYNAHMKPQRSAFFSNDKEKIYFNNIDRNKKEQIWVYSLSANKITKKINLSELVDHPHSKGNAVDFGINGRGIICSYPEYNSAKNSYFEIFNFDTDTASVSVSHNQDCEAYYDSGGKFLLLFETCYDTLSLDYYHTGKVLIYDSGNGKLVNTLSLPAHGFVYTFNNFPDDLYYVADIETSKRQIFRINADSLLTK